MGFFTQENRSCCSDDSIGNDVFRGVPKHAAIFSVWKIEGLGAISIPRNKIGTFLTNAAYIIYAVNPQGGSLPYPGMPSKDIKGPVLRAIHFWIGRSCDSAVAGGTALRAAELDAQVSATILYRESEGRESPRFLSYFKDKLVVENNHPESADSCRLHRVTGISMPVLTELESVAWSNFSSLDVILIDTSTRGVIYIWVGSSSHPLHKKHAAKIGELKKENNNVRVVVVEDGYEQTMRKEDRSLFDSVLDPGSRIVSPGRNDFNKLRLPSTIKLYKCTEQSGKYKVAELKSGPIFKSDLSPSSVFFIDRGEAGVWAWVGREVNSREKLEAIRNARGFVKKKGYSSGTPVARALDGQEPSELKSLVRGWEDEKKRPLILPTKFDPDYMTERPRMAADCQLVDDGTGDRKLWKVTCKETTEVVRDDGIYYAASCYVMQYGYGAGRKSRILIYCWKGAHSPSLDREAALKMACKLGEETNGQLVIASQGREPAHLLQIYGGKLTILCGEHKENPPKKYLVRVLGSTPYTSKAVERPLRASSLDSSGVFILFSSSSSVVWCGGKSTGDSREASRRLAPATTPLISEGKEDDSFWTELGGKTSYSTESTDDSEHRDRRLYHCEVEEGAFVGQEIFSFTQSSLIPEGTWLLDTGNVVWVWLGNNSTTKTLREAIEKAEIFVFTHPAGRDRNTVITAVRQGFEPPTFVGVFDNWNHNLLRDYQSFNALRTILQNEEEPDSNLKTSSVEAPSGFDNSVKYPLKLLKNEPENLPEGVDVERKEMHLTYDDFVAVFKIKPAEFEKLPAWRKRRLKQTAGLF